MLEHTTNTNIRIKKSYLLDNSKLTKATGIGQTKYSPQPFGKYFIDKNKSRINPIDNSKLSDRYLVNVTKLQKIGNNDNGRQNQRPTMNNTLSNCVSADEFNYNSSLSKVTSTSQSHRSHLLAVNIKRLPRLSSSTTGFNGSHNKMEMIKDEMEMLANETIDMVTRARDFSITFGRVKNGIQSHCNEVQKQLKNKVSDLQKLVNQTKQKNKDRSDQLKSDCMEINQKNIQMKQYLQMVQQRIQSIQNALGVITGHHKHLL